MNLLTTLIQTNRGLAVVLGALVLLSSRPTAAQTTPLDAASDSQPRATLTLSGGFASNGPGGRFAYTGHLPVHSHLRLGLQSRLLLSRGPFDRQPNRDGTLPGSSDIYAEVGLLAQAAVDLTNRVSLSASVGGGVACVYDFEGSVFGIYGVRDFNKVVPAEVELVVPFYGATRLSVSASQSFPVSKTLRDDLAEHGPVAGTPQFRQRSVMVGLAVDL